MADAVKMDFRAVINELQQRQSMNEIDPVLAGEIAAKRKVEEEAKLSRDWDNALDRAGIWLRDNVHADTALASPAEMRHFLEHYGPHKLLFGSDYPFGLPAGELRKIERLNLNADDFARVVAGNILTLLAAVTDPS